MRKHKYIALVAPIGAGKTTLARYFESKGFELYKLSYAIYEEADRQKRDKSDRITLQDIGDEMRKKLGYSALAKIALEKLEAAPRRRFVIDSIRNHHEVETLKKALGKNLLVVAVTAPLDIRYKRVVKRKGQYKEQLISLEEFKKIDARDLGMGNKPNEQNVAKCIELADTIIKNESTIQSFEKTLAEFYNKYF